jgi:DNA-binding transcriptional LysR family regulator
MIESLRIALNCRPHSESIPIMILAVPFADLMLDPRRLLTFREVARRRSFSKAADALALTQPAVSQQIASLERLLGVKLIDRRRGHFSLTPAGELALAHADALATRLRLAETQLEEAVGEARRRLRIGAFPSLLATLLPAAIADLRRTNSFEISAVQGGTNELATAVADGRLHAAVCFEDAAQPRREHPEASRSDLFEEPMQAALGPTHRLARRRTVRLTDLANDPWIAAEPAGLIANACRGAGFEPNVAYLTTDPLAIRALIARGLAVTLTPRLLASELHGISTPTIAGDAPHRRIYALTPSTEPHPLVAPLLDSLRSG